MSASKSTRVEMVPASVEDFVSVEVTSEEAEDWLGLIQRSDFFDILPKMKPVAFRCRDNGHTSAIMGTGGIPLPGRSYILPWVWAVFDQQTIRERGKIWAARAMQEVKRPIQEWLNENASLFFTDPQIIGKHRTEAYTSTLAAIGFRDLGHGLWQWPGGSVTPCRS